MIETKEGPTIVAAGGSDLTTKRKALAREKGLLVADDMPDFHAEITALSTAGERGLLPTKGVLTNKMCMDGSDSCFEQLSNIVEGNPYKLCMSKDRRSFECVKSEGK